MRRFDSDPRLQIFSCSCLDAHPPAISPALSMSHDKSRRFDAFKEQFSPRCGRSSCIFRASCSCAAVPLQRSKSGRRHLTIPNAFHDCGKELLFPLGRLLPPGLVRTRLVLACSRAPRASVTARFAAVSKLRLVLRWFARDWRTGHEQLSADDRHQPGPKPDEALWMDRSHAQLQHVIEQQCPRGQRRLLESFRS